MTGQKSTHVSEAKKKIVTNLIDLIKKNKTTLVASIKNIPGSQFQEISKKLRGKAIVKVPKKNLIFRALDESGNKAIKDLKEKIKNSSAILFSDLDSFDLARELIKNRSPAKAKTGQEAPEDIVIEEGPTELVPGPAISELGALGIQIQIQDGKIHIKQSKTIVKEGEKISQGAAEIMNKLGIKPFSIGFTPLAAFDSQERKLYLELKIDKEGTLIEIKNAYGKALAFAVDIGYANENTIKFLIGKASSHEKTLSNLIKEGVKEIGSSENDNNQQPESGDEIKSKDENNQEQKDNTDNTQTPEENKSEEKSEGEDK